MTVREAVLAMCAAAMLASGSVALDVVERPADDPPGIIVENAHFKVVLTTLGGRVRSWVDKATGREIVLWAPGEGGFLDDRATRTMARYDCRVLARDEEHAEVEFTLTDGPLRWRKTIAIREGLPSIQVRYSITNMSDEPRDFEQMVRNFIVPTEGLFCSLHTDQGVQRIPWGDWTRSGGKGGWYRRMAGDWLSVAHREGWGFAVVCDRLSAVYFWTGQGRGTVEWVYPTARLNAGETASAETTLTLTHGMDNMACATRDCLIGLSWKEHQKAFDIETVVAPVSTRFRAPMDALLRSRFLDGRRRPLAELPGASLQLSLANAPVALRATWKAPADGLYILCQELMVGDEKIAEYETPLVAGFLDESTPAYSHPRFPPERKMLELEVAEDDLRKGYFLHYPTVGPRRRALSEIALDLCRGEQEFVQVECTTFADLGEVSVTLTDADGFPGRATILVEKDYRLLEGVPLTARPGVRSNFFVRLDTHGVKEGDYAIGVRFAPQTGSATEVPIRIKVWPVELPERDDLYVSFFWSSFESIFSTLYPQVRDTAEQMRIWRACLRQMRLAGQNILEIRPGVGRPEPYIRLVRFDGGSMPVLDLQGWTEVLRIAREEGMRHAIFRYGWWHDSWLPPGYGQMAPQEQERVRLFILQQLVAHLRAQGFERIFWYLIDELDPSPEKVEAVCGQMDRAAAAVTGLEFAGSGFASTPLPTMQQLADRLTWVAPYWVVYSVVEWMNRGELKLRPGTIRGSQISGDHKGGYTATRLAAWQYWRGGLNGYQVYGYYTRYPNHGYSCVFPGAAEPVPSPTWAGLVDAWEDFLLLHEFQDRLLAGAGADAGHRTGEIAGRLMAPKDAPLGWELASYAGFVSPRVTGDDEAIRSARREVLRTLLETKPTATRPRE